LPCARDALYVLEQPRAIQHDHAVPIEDVAQLLVECANDTSATTIDISKYLQTICEQS